MDPSDQATYSQIRADSRIATIAMQFAVGMAAIVFTLMVVGVVGWVLA